VKYIKQIVSFVCKCSAMTKTSKSKLQDTIHELKYSEFESKLAECKGSKNVTHLRSIWGQVCEKCQLPNTLIIRQFFSNWTKIIPETEKVICILQDILLMQH
jgi:hypothetical protein